MASTLYYTETMFDAATRSNIVSSDGVVRFGDGSDFSTLTGWTIEAGTGNAVDGREVVSSSITGQFIVSRDGTSVADGTFQISTIIPWDGTQAQASANPGIMARFADVSNYAFGALYSSAGAGVLSVNKRVAGTTTELATTADTWTQGQKLALRFVTSGVNATLFDDTNVKSVTTAAILPAGAGKWGLRCNMNSGPTTVITFFRTNSTALSGSISLPTSTTYTDLGTAQSLNVASWIEDLTSGGDVTVDVFASSNGSSDANSWTGLTTPEGSSFDNTIAYRYWRVVVNFTRSTTAQEPTLSVLALALGLKASAAGSSGLRYSPRDSI